MEAGLALSFINNIYNKFKGQVYSKDIVLDDDSTLRAHCHNIINGSKLDNDISEPRFLVDLSHIIKCMVKPIFKLCTSSKVKDILRYKSIDYLRLKRYSGCFVAKNRGLTTDEFLSETKALIEHWFNCHT